MAIVSKNNIFKNKKEKVIFKRNMSKMYFYMFSMLKKV